MNSHMRATFADIKALEHRLIQLTMARFMAENSDAAERCRLEIAEVASSLAEMSSSDIRTVLGIAKIFELSETERDLLLLAFAPELDPQFRMGFSNISPLMAPDGRPTIGLLSALSQDRTHFSSLTKRTFLSRQSRLRRYRLIEVFANVGWSEADAFVLLTPAVRELLLGQILPSGVVARRGIASEVGDATATLSTRPDVGDRLLVIGEQAPERRGAAAAFAAKSGYDVVFTILTPGEKRADEINLAIDSIRDATMLGALPVLELDNIDGRHQGELLSVLLRGDVSPRGTVIVSMARDETGTLTQLARDTVRYFVPPLGFDVSRQRWAKGATQAGLTLSDADVDLLGNSFRMEPWVIEAVIRHTQSEVSDSAGVTVPMLAKQARQTAGAVSVSHARRISPKQTLDQMILPETVRDHLALLIGFAGKREQLLHEYGYAKRFSMGQGLVALFSGESGTGKTMAAEVLAHALEKDLYIVDLSRLVSKWVGETEKNIDKIFSEADQTQGVLLFDEADSLFANRSGEVNSSNDRYANMEVGYLLQRIESYRGIAVLTTNLSQNIDDAFLRRFHFRIDFPKPTAALREKLWQKMLKGTGYSEDGLDLNAISARYELTGGNIRNALMKATYLADRDKLPIGQKHLKEAALLESLELGRLV